MKSRRLLALTILLICGLFLASVQPVAAAEGAVLGIHILHPAEAQNVSDLLRSSSSDEWHYVTIPLSLQDLRRQDEWKTFFQFAKTKKLYPIVRLVTKFEDGAWQVPTKKNITDLIGFLSKLEWPSDRKYIIAFNEVNHAKEWGNSLDPAGYAEVLKFTSNWAKSEGKNYYVLPAAMDLAAPNGSATLEAFNYLEKMHQSEPSIFEYVDYWNSHSYPNPAFSSPPEATGKNSLRGFTHELAFLKEKTGREFQTFITETGWVENAITRPRLTAYYQYATDHIWNDPRVMAVTPFVLSGDPGPFAGFTFLNRNNQPTDQYRAYQSALKKLAEKK